MNHVDWDLLAEHLGGALAGTPEEDRVARLIATDPGWARAAADLVGALDAVAADLRAVPAVPPMPEDVAARLDAALRAPCPVPERTAGRERRQRAWRGPAAERPAAAGAELSPAAGAERHPVAGAEWHPVGGATGLAVAPTGGRPPARPGHRSPQRQRRAGRRAGWWGAGAAVAAGVVAFAALGLGALTTFMTLGAGDNDEAGGAAADAPGAAAPEPAAEPRIVATGTDYRPESPLFASRLVPPPGEAREFESDGFQEEAPGEVPEEAPGDNGATAVEVPEELSRVYADLQPCLDAVQAEYGPAPSRVSLVDFARFEQEPAVVIWVTTADGVTWVTVAGPDCGTAGAGPDERYQARLD